MENEIEEKLGCTCTEKLTEIIASVEKKAIDAIEGFSYQSPNRVPSMLGLEKARVKTEHELEIDKTNRERLEQFRLLREEKGKGYVPKPAPEKSGTLLTGKV